MKQSLVLFVLFVSLVLATLAGCMKLEAPLKTGLHEVGEMQMVAYNAQHREIWRETLHNALANEGQYLFLDTLLRGATQPANFYLRMYNTTPTKTSTLAGITASEATGNGYAPILVEHSATGWPTLALDTGDYKATSKTVTFTASGGSWGPVTYCVLATTSDNTGKLVAYLALSQSRTLASGESLQVTYAIKQQ